MPAVPRRRAGRRGARRPSRSVATYAVLSHAGASGEGSELREERRRNRRGPRVAGTSGATWRTRRHLPEPSDCVVAQRVSHAPAFGRRRLRRQSAATSDCRPPALAPADRSAPPRRPRPRPRRCPVHDRSDHRPPLQPRQRSRPAQGASRHRRPCRALPARAPLRVGSTTPGSRAIRRRARLERRDEASRARPRASRPRSRRARAEAKSPTGFQPTAVTDDQNGAAPKLGRIECTRHR